MSLVELDVKVETDAGQKVETRELPLLDLGKFLAGDRSDNRALADELRQAGEEVGFLAVVNHGIPQNLIDQAIEQNMRFCALPMERK